MRTILAACVALSAAGFALATPARADVTITTPGVAVEGPYWRHHHPDSEWRARREFREAQHEHAEWLRDHCVRDWSGTEYCRR